MKRLSIIFAVLTLSVGFGSFTSQADELTRTPGYWKNHPEAWPVLTLSLGGSEYSQDDCLSMLGRPARGDHSVVLCRALIAAKLNLILGCNGSCVTQEIQEADGWLAQFGPVGSKVSFAAKSSSGELLSEVLDNYNNGMLCAPGPMD